MNNWHRLRPQGYVCDVYEQVVVHRVVSDADCRRRSERIRAVILNAALVLSPFGIADVCYHIITDDSVDHALPRPLVHADARTTTAVD